jgi:molybdopterin/thiamine biosynthesis adenylyltransferase
MDEAARRHELHREMRAAGFRPDRAASNVHLFVGERRIAGRNVAISIGFLDLEFTRLPVAKLLDPDREAPEVVAHLDNCGGLCFARHGDVVLDRYDIPGSVQLCVRLVDQGLERTLTHKRLQDEVAQEFQQHWDGATFFYDLQTEAAHLALFTKLPDDVWALRRSGPLPQRLGGPKSVKKKNKENAVVISVNSELTFQHGQGRPETLAEFLAFCESGGYANRSEVVRLVTHGRGLKEFVFLHAPNGCVGIRIMLSDVQRRSGFRPVTPIDRVRTRPETCEVTRLSGSAADLPHIFERNMHDQNPLTATNITLIGCGTIGSHLAKMLVQSGAGHLGGRLLLVDNQSLAPGNIGRHYLGPIHIGAPKAEALKSELQRCFPDCKIIAVSNEALGAVGMYNKDDLVIDATGEEALAIALNDHLFGGQAARLHVALFGNGAAAQALLVDGDEYACYRCLKTIDGKQWRYDPMKPGNAPEERAAACGEGNFIPYAVAAPSMAAGVALQLALDWRSGDPSRRLRTLQIDKKLASNIDDKNPKKLKDCPACEAYRVRTV